MGRNKILNEKIRDERREKILSVALRLFAGKGPASTKSSDIAKAAGISQGLVYHYFRSKDDILVELIRTAFARINDTISDLEAMPLDARLKIRMSVAELLRGLSEDQDMAFYHLLIAQTTSLATLPSEARTIIDQESLLPYQGISRIMEEGISDGLFVGREASELALLFWSTIRGLAIYKALHGEHFRSPNPDTLMGMFLKNI